MKKNTENSSMILTTVTALAALALILVPAAGIAEEGDTTNDLEVIVGAQTEDVTGDQPGSAQFDKYRDVPGGIVLDYLDWAVANDDNTLRVRVWDATQGDERFQLDARVGQKWKIRGGFLRMPFSTGGGAVSPLARGKNDEFGAVLGLADFIQQNMEDPDGNGIPFYTDAAETAKDNALVQGLMNDLLTGYDPFTLGTDRLRGNLGATYRANRHWTTDLDASLETKNGTIALGSGTYQRITDVNGDGITDYDYFFSIRGKEIAAPIDQRTTRVLASLNYQNEKAFGKATFHYSEFDNKILGVTYDNPFWFTDTTGSGALRGLWEKGRASQEPGNEAWDLSFSGGYNLPARTRVSAVVSFGEQTQNVGFLPITTNSQTVGLLDINGDGVINELDDPTNTSAFNSSFIFGGVPTISNGLDATTETTNLNFTVTSKPMDGLKLLGRYRYHASQGQEGIQSVQARTDYIESRLVDDFKKDTMLHVPIDFTRETIDLEATYGFSGGFKVTGYYRLKSYGYDQYAFDPNETDQTRDSGTRAVSGTNDNTFGLRGHFAGNDWFSGWINIYTSDRTYDGVYTPSFDGENPDVRQFDIADRDRDAIDLQLDFMPSTAWNLGVRYYTFRDDFADTEYGLQKRDVDGIDFSVNYMPGEKLTFFAFLDISEFDDSMHLRTKCSNCSAPIPALAPWDVPGFDWFSTYTDKTTAAGLGVQYDSQQASKIDFSLNYNDGQIDQTTVNPIVPRELNPANPLFGQIAQVALGFPFPQQSNKLLNAQIKYTYAFSPRVSAGIWYLYEDFSLEDFQLDDLEAYGANFLDVEDATRYLFLGSRIDDYQANVIQAFVHFTM